MERLKIKNLLKRYIPEKRLLYFLLIVNVCVLIFITFSSYAHTPLSGFKDYLIYGIHVLLLQFTVSGFIYLLMLNKWVFRIVFNTLFISLSLLSFWIYTQDISVTEPLLDAIFQTKPSIIVSVLSYQYLIYIFLSLLCLFFINRLYNNLKLKFSSSVLILSIFSILTFFIVEAKRYGTLKSRMPYSFILGLANHIDETPLVLKKSTKKLTIANKVNVVFVLGETVRADHLGLNGYYRETTPLLSQRDDIISFPNIYTPFTYTATSLPMILTDYDGVGHKKDSLMSIYNVFNNAGYNTQWIGNQELESGFKSIVKTNKEVILIDSLRSVYSFKKALDKDLLNHFKVSNELSFSTIQMMGSHWYYNNRVTDRFRVFKPISDSKYIPSQSKEQLVNSYDNTILYLDYFIDNLITKLEKLTVPTVLIYLSDHGEALGEDGVWLHAQDSEYSKNPAMLLWFSETFRERFPDYMNTAKENSKKRYDTSFFYHSLLSLIKPNHIEYNPKMSIFQKEKQN